MSTLEEPVGDGTGAAEGDPAACAGVDGETDGDGAVPGCLPGEAIRYAPSPASTTTTTANSAFCWPADRSIALCYFLRRTGRSQKGSGASGGSAPPPSRPLPEPAGPVLPGPPGPTRPADGPDHPDVSRARARSPPDGGRLALRAPPLRALPLRAEPGDREPRTG